MSESVAVRTLLSYFPPGNRFGSLEASGAYSVLPYSIFLAGENFCFLALRVISTLGRMTSVGFSGTYAEAK